MASVVDTLVTKYQLDGEQYKREAAEAVRATEGFGASLGKVHSAIGGVLDRLKGLAVGALATGGALVGSAIAAGTYAVKSAIGFDTIQRSLQAVTKSAERAKAILSFDDKLAGPSIFGSEDLAQASLTLEAFKLTTERFLPVAEKLGTVFGASKDSLMEFVNAMGYIKNNRFGEGFESLTRAGLSREDFEAQGLTFDKAGSFKGSADEALTAIEKLVAERFGKLAEAMADGPAAKLASVMDAIGRAARIAGNAILTVLMPAADRLGQFVSYLVDSGAVERISTGLSSLFSGKDIGDALIHALAYLIATVQNLPAMIDGIYRSFRENFNRIRAVIIPTVSLMTGLFVGEAIINGITAMIQAYRVLTTVIKGAAVAQAVLTGLTGAGLAVIAASLLAAVGVSQYLDSQIPKLGEKPVSLGLPPNKISGDASKIVSDFNKTLNDPAKEDKGKAAPVAPSTQLERIAKATEGTREEVKLQNDLNRQLLGGSTLASQAVSERNIARATGRGSTGNAALDRGFEAIAQAFHEATGAGVMASKRAQAAY